MVCILTCVGIYNGKLGCLIDFVGSLSRSGNLLDVKAFGVDLVKILLSESSPAGERGVFVVVVIDCVGNDCTVKNGADTECRKYE